MATAPATGAPANALIMALRAATPTQGQASTLRFYDNPQNSVYTPRELPVYGGMPWLPKPDPVVGPPKPPAFTPPVDTVRDQTSTAPRPSVIQPKSTLISLDDEPVTPDVPDYTDDLFGPDVGPPKPPGPDVGPPAPAQTYPVYTAPAFTSRLIEEKSPSVNVIQGLPVSTGSAPPTDAADDFEIDREAGLVSQYDLYGPFLNGNLKTDDSKSPSVSVIEGLDVTNTPAVNTDPADDFEIDREAGLIQQSDLMEPRATSPTAAPAPAQATSIRDVGNVTSVTEPLDVYYPFDESVFELIDTPPTFNAVEALAPSALVDTATAEEIQMMNMLEDYLAQENLLASSDYWNRLNRLDDQLQQR